MLRKLRKNYRRLVAFMLTVAMTFTNIGTNLNVAFASGEELEALFLVDGADLKEAIQDAVDSGETFKFSSLELKHKRKKVINSYEKLIGGKDGAVYQLDVDVDDRYAAEGTSLEVFYNAGREDVIFLFINESDMVIKFRVNVDGYETEQVSINPNTANVDDTEASYVEDYSNTTTVDDMPHTLGAEVLNPTTGAADANEGTEADETLEDVEGPAAEETTGAADESGAEETTSASVEEDTAASAEEGTEAGDDAGETTAAETSGEATSEETAEADVTAEETTVAETAEAPAEETEETTIEALEEETEADVEEEKAEPETEAETEAEPETEATPEEGSATASISMRKLYQVTSNGKPDIVIDQPDVPLDNEPEITENTPVEVDIEENTETRTEESDAPEPETTEEAAEESREAETEETTAPTEEETTAAGTEESSAAETEETTTATAEDGGNGAADSESDPAGVTDEETTSGADIIIEEEATTADETQGSDTPVKVEETTPAETEASQEDASAGQNTPVVEDEGQELEDDINGTLVKNGTLAGKAYDTVTIWGSANARAYKVAVKNLPEVELEEQEVPMPEMTLEASAGTMDVMVNAPEGAFPENTTVQVEEADADAVAEAVMEKLYKADMNIASIQAADITFTDENGEEIQPETAVEVVIDNIDTEASATRAFVYHMDASGRAERVAEVDPDATTVSFRASAFSVYAVVRTAGAKPMMARMMARSAGQTVSATAKTSDGAGTKSIELPVGIIQNVVADDPALESWEVEGIVYTFKEARLNNAPVYAVAKDGEKVYITTSQDQLAGIEVDSGDEIILYYESDEKPYTVTYQVMLNSKTRVPVNENGEAKTGDVIHTKVIGRKQLYKRETLEFVFSQKLGYTLEGVDYTVNGVSTAISPNADGKYAINGSNVNGDVTVTISLTKGENYKVYFHGSNTYYYSNNNYIGQSNSESNKPSCNMSYTAAPSVTFQLRGRDEHGTNSKTLNKLVLTMNDGMEVTYADIPTELNTPLSTKLPSGGTVTVTKTSEGKTTGRNPHTLPWYTVTIAAANGDEVHKDIDVATNYKENGSAEVWAIRLVGVEPLSCWNGSKYSTLAISQLNPVEHMFANRKPTSAPFYVYIKATSGYSTTELPTVTVKCDGKETPFEINKIPSTGNNYGMGDARSNGHQWYFVIPGGVDYEDIRIYVTAQRTVKRFAAFYDYNGGKNADGSTVGVKMVDNSYTSGQNIMVGDGKAEPPAKDAEGGKTFTFGGWGLVDTNGDVVKTYQTDDPFTFEGSDIPGTVIPTQDDTGDYVYTFKAIWNEVVAAKTVPYQIAITFKDSKGETIIQGITLTENGAPGKTAYINIANVEAELNSKIVAAAQAGNIGLPENWQTSYKTERESYSVVIPEDETQTATISITFVPANAAYKVLYYKDSNDGSTVESEGKNYLGKFEGEGTIGTTISGYDKDQFKPAGYKEATSDDIKDATISANAEKNTVYVVYKKRDDLTYTVKYYKDEVKTENEIANSAFTPEGTVTFQDKITLEDSVLNRHKPAGYQNGVQQNPVPYVIGEENNVINVLYTKASFPYQINRYYEDSNGEFIKGTTKYSKANAASPEEAATTVTLSVTGTAEYQSTIGILYPTTDDKSVTYAGKHYVLETVVPQSGVAGADANTLVVTDHAEDPDNQNVVSIYYALDEEGGTPENPGDGKPDKYQITFTFQTENAESSPNGYVRKSGDTEEYKVTRTETLPKILLNEDGTVKRDENTGSIVVDEENKDGVNPGAGTIGIHAVGHSNTTDYSQNYVFEYWSSTAGSDMDYTSGLTDLDKKTYTEDTTFTAHFAVDAYSSEDETDPGKPDGTPDSWQVIFTYDIAPDSDNVKRGTLTGLTPEVQDIYELVTDDATGTTTKVEIEANAVPTFPTVTPHAGYEFQTNGSNVWTEENGTAVPENAKYKENKNFLAHITEKGKVTLSYVIADGQKNLGSITPRDNDELLPASENLNGKLPIEAQAESGNGYHFDKWTIQDDGVWGNTALTVDGKQGSDKAVALTPEIIDTYAKRTGAYENMTFVAHFAEDGVTITYQADHGTVRVNEEGNDKTSETTTAVNGTLKGAIATPAPGYRFDKWTKGENTELSEEEIQKYVKQNLNGSVEITAEGVKELSKDGGTILKDATFKAHFVEDTVTITYRTPDQAKGKVKLNTDSAIQGEDAIDTIWKIQGSAKGHIANGAIPVAGTGYHFTGWTLELSETEGGKPVECVAEDGTLAWTDISELAKNRETSDPVLYKSITLIANFAPNGVEITYKVSTAGGEGNGTVELAVEGAASGSTAAETEITEVDATSIKGAIARPDKGYHFVKWTLENDSTEIAGVFSDQYGNVTLPAAVVRSISRPETSSVFTSKTFVAHFEEDTVTITYEPSPSDVTMGKVKIGNEAATDKIAQTIWKVQGHLGDTYTVTPVPEPGYEFTGWTVTESADPAMGIIQSDVTGTDPVTWNNDWAWAKTEPDSEGRTFYKALTFTANFIRKGDVKITYQAVTDTDDPGKVGGYVRPIGTDATKNTSAFDEEIWPGATNSTGAMADEAYGYVFTGWTIKVNGAEQTVSTDKNNFQPKPDTETQEYAAITYTAHFQPSTEGKYEIRYVFDGDMEHYESLDKVQTGIYGTPIPDTETTAPAKLTHNGTNYVKEKIGGVTIIGSTDPEDPSIMYVYYEKDEMDGEHDNPTSTEGDGIPDKYQIHFHFTLAKDSEGKGTVTGTKLDQIFTIYPKTGKKDDNGYDTYETTPQPKKPDVTEAFVKAEAATGNAFDYWDSVTNGKPDQVKDFDKGLKKLVTDHEGYTTPGTVIFYAHFDTDTKGGKDDPTKPSGFPDKYEVIVTYNVVHGNWSTGDKRDTSDPVQKVLHLTNDAGEYDEKGSATYIAPTANNPAEGYQAGSWSVVKAGDPDGEKVLQEALGTAGAPPTGDKAYTKAHDGSVYTYTYLEKSYNLTVKHVYRGRYSGSEEVTQLIDPSTVDHTKSIGTYAAIEVPKNVPAPKEKESADGKHYTFEKVTVTRPEETLADGTVKQEETRDVISAMSAENAVFGVYYDTAGGRKKTVTGAMPAHDLVITFYYDEDTLGGEKENEGDGKPDRYQVEFTYQVENTPDGTHGTIRKDASAAWGTDPIKEVKPTQEVIRNEAGVITGKTPKDPQPQPPTLPDKQGNTGYTYDRWFDQNNELKDTYDTDMTFTVSFKTNPGDAVSVSYQVKPDDKNVKHGKLTNESSEQVQIITGKHPDGGELTGSTATAHTGYVFDGWYVKGTAGAADLPVYQVNTEGERLPEAPENVYTGASLEGAVLTANLNRDTVNHFATTVFEARFKPKDEKPVTVTYEARLLEPIEGLEGISGGKIAGLPEGAAVKTETIQEALEVGELEGATAVPDEPDYEFLGWYRAVKGDPNAAPEPINVSAGTLDGTTARANLNQKDGGQDQPKVYDNTTFIAMFGPKADSQVRVSYDLQVRDASGNMITEVNGRNIAQTWPLSSAGNEISNVDRIQTITAAGLKGSTATDIPGFDFEGWFRDEGVDASGNEIQDTKVTGDLALTATEAKGKLNKTNDTVPYQSTVFIARFKEKTSVTLVYEAQETDNRTAGRVKLNRADGQLLARTSEEVAPATGSPAGATAVANLGYEFDRWELGTRTILEGQPEEVQGTLSTQNVADSAKNQDGLYEDNTLFKAYFREAPEVTIRYIVEKDDQGNTHGTVSRESETLRPVSGIIQGSTAQAATGYEFAGWELVEENPDGTYRVIREVTDKNGSTSYKPSKEQKEGREGEAYQPAIYMARFTERTDLTYKIEYYYGTDPAAPGRYTLGDTAGIDKGATFGSIVDPDAMNPSRTSYNGKKYVFERIDGRPDFKVTATDADNVWKVYYALDAIGETNPDDPADPEQLPDRPDGIPDKYQIRFDYESAGNGSLVLPDKSLVQKSSEVQTVYKKEDILGLDNPAGGVTLRDGAVRLEAKPEAVPGVSAADQYAFDHWENQGRKDFTKDMREFADPVVPYTRNQKFVVYFDKDEIGDPTDPQKPEDIQHPDGIPDKYQITVTFQVTNGSWNEDGMAKRFTRVLDLIDNGKPAENGTAAFTAPGAGSRPETGYQASDKGWNRIPPTGGTFGRNDAGEYMYTYELRSFTLNVNHVYRPSEKDAEEQTFPSEPVARKFNSLLDCVPAEAASFGLTGTYILTEVAAEGLTENNFKDCGIIGNMPANDVTVTFYYDADNKGTTDPETPDGIPDKYQITFIYKAGDNGGFKDMEAKEVREVVTLYGEFQNTAKKQFEPVGERGARPANPPQAEGNEGFYFYRWFDGSNYSYSNGELKGRTYTEPENWIWAQYKENPNNAWAAKKDVVNTPARGYFRVGEDAVFEIRVWMKEGANRPITGITVTEERDGAYFETYAGCGYTVDANDPRVAHIDRLETNQDEDHPVILRAVYKVTRNDLFDRNFDNTVLVEGKIDKDAVTPNEPDDKGKTVTPLRPSVNNVPAGAQGGGSGGSGGGGGGGSSTRSPGTTQGGPGTVTIDPEAVPLANLPDMGNDDILALIDDEEVPLAALPKTGQTGSAALMFMLSSMMLAAFAAVTRKKEEEQ